MKALRFVLLFLALACVSSVRAYTRSATDLAREAKIEQQLTAIDPTLVEPFRQARIAMDADKYTEAAALLAPITARAPAFDPALRRLGIAKIKLGEKTAGLQLVQRALAQNRSADNLASLAYALAFAQEGSPAEQDQAINALAEAVKLPGGDDAQNLLALSQLSFQRERVALRNETVARLLRQYPDLMQTHYFAAVAAAYDEHWNRAVAEIHRAEKLGLDHAQVSRFLDSGVQSRATGWFLAGGTGWVIGIWALGLALLLAVGFALSKLTLRQIERADPNVPITPGEHRLRRIYRTLLNLAGIYYYISLPVVIVLVIAGSAAIVYGFLLLGWMPLKLVAILIIGAIVTVVAMIRSLFIRIKTEDIGRLLDRAEAPGLWQLADEVAATLQTRPIDEIRLTAGTDLCVYERGSWREKLENRAKRILVVGVAVLDGFKQADFRSVLAHEYGHFSNRDTAGGDIALRVQNDMMKFYRAMFNAGQATKLNLAFHFLRVYHFIFRRISHGATRLQEVLADRVAAQHYGALAFEGGLRHVIRQSIAFDLHAHSEITSAIKAQRPLQNLYAHELSLGSDGEDQFKQALERATTDDDTHPAPRDRFRLIAKLPAVAGPSASGVVWQLFTDRDAIVAEMTAQVEKNIAGHRN